MPEIMPQLSLPWLDFNKYKGKTVLVAQAHADDADFGCGGAVARLADAGADVVYVVATKGEAGSAEPGMTKDALTEIREQEQRDANAVLGVRETVFLGHGDGRLNRVTDLDKIMTDIVRERKPDLIFTFDPDWPEHSMHPDHYAIAIAAMRAAQFSPLSLTYTDDAPAEPFQCGEVLLFGPRKPNVWVNVSQYSFKKLEALAAHKSQMVHLLPKKLYDLMYKMVEGGDRFDKRILAGLLHTSFIVEPFRRPKGMGLLH